MMSINYPESLSGLEKLGAGQPKFYPTWMSASSRRLRLIRRRLRREKRRRLRFQTWHYQQERLRRHLSKLMGGDRLPA
jgi:hypothetical protein